ncbi:peptidoglycan DD-metalloendopeptidase family protein [Streptomyces sp. NBC_01716]
MTLSASVSVDLDTKTAEASLTKLTADRVVKVTASLDDEVAKKALTKLTADQTVSIAASLDDATAKKALDKLTTGRTIDITASLDEAVAKAVLVKLTADRTVKITVDLDAKAAETALGKLTRDSTINVDVAATINDAAYKKVEKALDKLTADRNVNIRPIIDTRVAADELRNLSRRQRVRIGVDVDTRVAAADIANLTRRREVGVTAQADTAGANTALAFLTRNRTVDIRARLLGLGALTAALGALGGGGGSGGGMGMLSSRILAIAAAALLALPQVAALGSSIAQMGPLAAVAAPAILTLIGAFAAIKLGASGIGDAIKAAFTPVPAEAKAAATATRQVETAQRGLANAQRGVTDAERSLSQAQRAARAVQAELSAARRQAARDLEDMNQRLRQGSLDQKQAALDVSQAELDLQNVRTDPAATQLQIQQADLALQRARAAAEEQARQQKRLQVDTAAANKAGVSGSDAVVQARERIRAAGEQVEERERGVADAHRAVADAARAVADAQSSAATQTSALDTALAKLSPNARQFVGILQSMAPAWRAMRLDVQDALFAGLGTRLQQVGGQVLPTVRTGVVGLSGVFNTMGKEALTAVGNLEKTGQLKGTFDVIRNGLGNLAQIPGQIVTGLAQLTIAAGPAWDRITAGAGNAMDRAMDSLAAGLENGSLEDAISTALDVAVQFGGVLADLGGIFSNVFGAAAAGGGDFFAVVGAALEEIRRVTALPEVQSALTAIFTAVQAIASLLAGTLGAVIQAVLPLFAALAPVVTSLAEALTPVLVLLAQSLGQALMPIINALLPVIGLIGNGIISIVTALTPLLEPIGFLLGAIIEALAPVLATVVGVIVQLVQAVSGPLGIVIAALIPVVQLVGDLIAQVFEAIAPVLTPLIGLFAQIAGVMAGLFATAIKALIPALMPLIPVIIQVVEILVQLLTAVLTPLAPVISQIAGLFGQFLGTAMRALAPIVGQIAGLFLQLLPTLMPLIPAVVDLVMAVLQLLPALLELALSVIVPLMPLLVQLAGLLTGVLGAALKFLIPIVVWVIEMVTKLATIVVKIVTKIIDGFKHLFDVLLGHSIIPDIVNGAVRWFTSLRDKALGIFRAVRDGVVRAWQSLWNAVKSTATNAWAAVRKGLDKFADGMRGAFETLKKGLGKIWDGLKALVKAPIKFWIETVYNKGIVTVWNKTAAKIPGVPDLKPMSMPKGFARGGILPGQSSWRAGDDQLVPMRRGEGVYVSEAMRDPYERARLHAVNQAAMQGKSLRQFRGYAFGGIVDSIGDAVGGALSKGADVVRGGFADLAEAAFKPLKSGIKKTLGTNKNTYQGMIGQAPIGLIDKVIDFIRGKDLPPEGTGQWAKPVNVPYGTPFGKAGLMWSSGRHTGLDFPAKTGTRIGAVDSGQVRSRTSGGPYGQHIEISHGSGLTSLYAHMSAMLAKAGADVKRGQQIGRVGATGNVTGPHLHLEARINGRAVDPMRYLEGGTGGSAGKGVERYRGIVNQAIRQVGQSLSLVNTTLRRMNQESGGNPKAVNRNDINWINGTPSVGLMQVIRPTFNAYAGKYRNTGPKLYGVSTDPLANIYASMKYALSRYGSLSKAYNRIGGYESGGTARPGELAWVGEQGPELMRVFEGGVRIFNARQSAHMARTMGQPIPGYASGGTITVAGRRIDTGPVKASVGGDFLKHLAGTAAAINTAMNKVATALKNAFKGVKTTLDDKLIKQVNTQNAQLKKLAADRDKIRSTIATATTFATETSAGAANFTSLTGLPNGGLPFGADGILNGLNVRLGQLKTFGANLTILGKRGLSKDLIGQIIAAGPDQGAPYAAALVKATDSQLKSINSTQAAIGKATTAYGQSAANAMYDAGTQSGKGFLSGLKSQEASIVKAMADLAKKIQKTIKVELKISSPSKVTKALGRFTGLGYAQGIRETVPQAAAAASTMAAAVRSTTGVGASRIVTNQVSNQGGDRILQYNALVREQASPQSIQAALAMEELLLRPVMSGA